MRRAVLVLLTMGVLAGCATDVPGAAATPSPSPTASAPSSAPPGNRCFGEGGPAEAPNSGPDTEQYLGLTEHEASDLAKDNGFTLRVAGRDGKCYALTMDYRADRANVYLEDDVVTAAAIG